VYSNFRWESPESPRCANRWLRADEDSNNEQIRSRANAVAFIEIPPENHWRQTISGLLSQALMEKIRGLIVFQRPYYIFHLPFAVAA
jgi:hypothetical protein